MMSDVWVFFFFYIIIFQNLAVSRSELHFYTCFFRRDVLLHGAMSVRPSVP